MNSRSEETTAQYRINSIGSWLKSEFGCKVVKLSLDGGFTCPNRDGRKGNGGCLFCSEEGSGEHASPVFGKCAGNREGVAFAKNTPGHPELSEAMGEQIRLLSGKWPDCSYIAYFQSHTNTYAPVEKLRQLFEDAIGQPKVLGIAIATRPDCLGEDVLDLLEELNNRTFLWVELGLQTIHPNTMDAMNLCYSLEEYDSALCELNRRGIRVVTHLILGLPGESREMMLDSVRYVCRSPVFGIKLHMLNVVKDTPLSLKYPDYIPFETIGEYADLVIDALELIPEGITIHRIYAEAPKGRLISPPWARQKRKVLNTITRRMKERNTWQGRRAP